MKNSSCTYNRSSTWQRKWQYMPKFAVIPVSCNAHHHHHQIVTDVHFDAFSSTSLLRCAGYVPFICPISYDWYGSYEAADIWDRLLAIIGRVMTAVRGNLRGMYFQRLLYWALWFEWSEELNVQLLNWINKCYLPHRVMYYNSLMILIVSWHWHTPYHSTNSFRV